MNCESVAQCVQQNIDKARILQAAGVGQRNYPFGRWDFFAIFADFLARFLDGVCGEKLFTAKVAKKTTKVAKKSYPPVTFAGLAQPPTI